MRAIIRQGIADGEFLPQDLELATRTIIGMEEATTEWRSRCAGRGDDAIGEYVAAAALGILMQDPGAFEKLRADLRPHSALTASRNRMSG